MNMFSCLGVSQKPTDQRRGECYKVSDSHGPVAVPVQDFGHQKHQAGDDLNYLCIFSVCFSIYLKWGLGRNCRNVGQTPVIVISLCKGALCKG